MSWTDLVAWILMGLLMAGRQLYLTRRSPRKALAFVAGTVGAVIGGLFGRNFVADPGLVDDFSLTALFLSLGGASIALGALWIVHEHRTAKG